MRHALKISAALSAPARPTRRLSASAQLVTESDGTVVVVLHGHPIARRNPDGALQVRHAGWVTRTTAAWVGSAVHAMATCATGHASTAGGCLTVDGVPIGKDWTTLADRGPYAPQYLQDLAR